MKKRRGLKRYYRKLQQTYQCERWCKNICNFSTWYDLAHLHFDWKNYGNIRWKERREHLDVLFRHYAIMEREAVKVNRPFQLFILLHQYDSAQDALYLHTPNPNAENYPLDFSKYETECNFTNRPLAEYLAKAAEKGYSVLYSPTGCASCCLLFKRTVGDALTV